MATKLSTYNKPVMCSKAMVKLSSVVVLISHSVPIKLLLIKNLLFRSFASHKSPLAPSNLIFYAGSICSSA